MDKWVIKFLILLFLICTSFIAEAQTNSNDSLLKVWNDKTENDTIRLNAIQKLIWDTYLFAKPDSGFYYAQLEYNFAKSRGLKKQMANALHFQGISFAVRGNHQNALDYYQHSLQIRGEIGDQKGLGTSMNAIGLVYLNQSDTLKALHYFEQALYQYRKNHIRKESAATLGNIGAIKMDQGNYGIALHYFQEALTINREFLDQRGEAQCLGQIGAVYLERKMYTKGLDYLKQAVHISEIVSDNFWIARHLNKIGTILEKQGKHAEAKVWCEKALHVAEKARTLVQGKVSCKCLFEAYKGMNNSIKALEYHEKMTAYSDSIKNDETIKKLQYMEFSKQRIVDSLKQVAERAEIQYANEEVIREKNRTRNFLLGVGFILLMLSGGLYYRWRIISKAKVVIEAEQIRSENLLLNILPLEIAEELKETGKSDPRDFEMVSILFTDFIGFTQTAEKLSARELVMEINICFGAFDVICEKYKIEKIKTVGDAYMAAGGLPKPTDDSVQNTILAALEMQEFIAGRKFQKKLTREPAFEMRVGIHSGPVVAGIVGVKKFQFDIWGDTVNIASRMESSGEVGKVNISERTYELVKGKFKCVHRGRIPAKNKGKLDMYFVEERI